MPRPNPTDSIANNEFHDQGGYIVAEAEMLPTPRDESWLGETNLPGYTGTGYLRITRPRKSAVKGNHADSPASADRRQMDTGFPLPQRSSGPQRAPRILVQSG